MLCERCGATLIETKQVRLCLLCCVKALREPDMRRTPISEISPVMVHARGPKIRQDDE